MTRIDTAWQIRDTPQPWSPPRSLSSLVDLLAEASAEATSFAHECLAQPDAALDNCVGAVLACADACSVAAETLRHSVGACWTARRELLEAAAEQTRRCAERCERIEDQAGFCRRWSVVSHRCCEATTSVLAVLDEMLADGWPELWPVHACSASNLVQ